MQQPTYMLGGHFRVVSWVESRNGIVQYGESLRIHFAVVPDALQPEPDGVATVVARAPAPSEQVRYEAVTQAAAVRQYQDPSIVEAARYQHQTAHRYERVTSPVAEDAVREMRQTLTTERKHEPQIIIIIIIIYLPKQTT